MLKYFYFITCWDVLSWIESHLILNNYCFSLVRLLFFKPAKTKTCSIDVAFLCFCDDCGVCVCVCFSLACACMKVCLLYLALFLILNKETFCKNYHVEIGTLVSYIKSSVFVLLKLDEFKSQPFKMKICLLITIHQKHIFLKSPQ